MEDVSTRLHTIFETAYHYCAGGRKHAFELTLSKQEHVWLSLQLRCSADFCFAPGTSAAMPWCRVNWLRPVQDAGYSMCQMSFLSASYSMQMLRVEQIWHIATVRLCTIKMLGGSRDLLAERKLNWALLSQKESPAVGEEDHGGQL